MSQCWGTVALTVMLVALSASCYDEPASCNIRCNESSGCPGGMQCVDNYCRTDDPMQCTAMPVELAEVSIGGQHVCGVSATGAMFCWGANNRGQLGTSNSDNASRPTQIDSEKWLTVSSGSQHACGLHADGTAWCWGENADGQVKGEKLTTFATPVQVRTEPARVPPPFERLSAGARHTCAIGAGQLWCWGHELGAGTNNMMITAATRIGTFDDWRAISAGWNHTCGIRGDGQLYCWGGNRRGQVAPGGADVFVPTEVSVNGLQVLEVSAGDEGTCAIASATPGAQEGQLWCWGRNTDLLIDDTNVDIDAPVQMGTAETWRHVEVGATVRCAIDATSTAWCWGRSVNVGAIGKGLWNDEALFANAGAIGTFDAISLNIGLASSSAPAFGCARRGTEVSCWGDNDLGELGIGAPSRRKTPVKIKAVAGPWTTLRAGVRHTCATTATGTLYCWGADTTAQISAGVPRGYVNPCVVDEPCDFATPTRVPELVAHADDLALGDTYSCARDGATVRCWGASSEGALGATVDRGFATVQPPAGMTWARMWGGTRGNCGLTNTGAIACWGNVGGTTQNQPLPVMSPEVAAIDDAQLADGFTCLRRTTDNARVCWGINGSGQLGDGTTNAATATMPLVLDAGMIASVSVNGALGCAVTVAGGVVCWGDNSNGQCGTDRVTATVPTPVVVSSSTGPIAGCTRVSVGYDHACALCEGVVRCWGRDNAGALGREDVSTPDYLADPITLATSEVFVDIAARAAGTCALTATGNIYCWGDGFFGSNGDGGQARNIPTPIAPR